MVVAAVFWAVWLLMKAGEKGPVAVEPLELTIWVQLYKQSNKTGL